MLPTNNSENSNDNYQVGGSLQIDAPSYVERQADKDFYEGLKLGEFCYVLNSRQMGKSSLRVRTMYKLQRDNIACNVIDITAISSQDIAPSEWYLGVIRRLARSFTPKVKVLTWWKNYEGLSPLERLNEFIESVLLIQVQQKIVIFIDEIDSIIQLNFKDDFLGFLRACYNKRADNPAYQRLTFALLGVAAPYDLIQDKNRTPFNIGRAIQLNGFEEHEAQPLAQGLVGKVAAPQTVLKQVLAWSGGQPFLTQKICKLILTSNCFIPKGYEAEFVENLVQSQIINNWESQDEPAHLKTIRDRILRSEQRSIRLLNLYQQILLNSEITSDYSPEQIELRLSGLVVKQKGCLRVYNRIYESVFNQTWVNKALHNLIPYRFALEEWIASNYQNKSLLLSGEKLKSAQEWAESHYINEQEHHFLIASLELEKQKLQIAASTKYKSQQNWLKKYRFSALLVLSVFVPILVMGVRHLGLLQNWELQAFDYFMRLRPNEKPDPRILVVKITENDFQLPQQQHRKGSLSDDALFLVLQKLQQYQARTIGLDIYRDFPVDPKYPKLLTQIKNSNLIAICKTSEAEFNNPGVLPPPEIPVERQGFSDFVKDRDAVIRRHLLAMRPNSTSGCTTLYAFNSQLAFDYFKSLGISIKYTKNKELQIGEVVFKRLRSHQGGYQQIDDRGYQILLNYRSAGSPLKVAEQVTLQDIISDRVKPEMVKDRIVIIGVTAQSAGDYFLTPYSAGEKIYQEIPGVIVHTQMVSQILSAVLDKRPLLSVWPVWGESLWIWAWSITGGILAWCIRHPIRLGMRVVVALGCLFGISFGMFIKSIWIPLIPPILVFLIMIISISLYFMFQDEKRKQYSKSPKND
ncbi:CHASE2 domain-containing protein [Nostoc sp. FACHB-110]|uniref:CHASE2 domain-containing protein n=1 Tax=Nostoc sp. FACHB-110 TaxID=2692834 RepID=UPI00168721BC|nr:CHASE2 domain-containing protein [Nostoc sp. FACHB-110]MBD2441520.1 CHASE2 domain-containing protein [Nostoc sp. FACHB-110]